MTEEPFSTMVQAQERSAKKEPQQLYIACGWLMECKLFPTYPSNATQNPHCISFAVCFLQLSSGAHIQRLVYSSDHVWGCCGYIFKYILAPHYILGLVSHITIRHGIHWPHCSHEHTDSHQSGWPSIQWSCSCMGPNLLSFMNLHAFIVTKTFQY